MALQHTNKRYWTYALSYTVVVALSVVLSILWVGSWMPGLPIGVLLGIPIAALFSWLVRRRAQKSRP